MIRAPIKTANIAVKVSMAKFLMKLKSVLEDEISNGEMKEIATVYAKKAIECADVANFATKIPLISVKYEKIHTGSNLSKNKIVLKTNRKSLRRLNIRNETREGKRNEMLFKNLEKDFNTLNLNHETRKGNIKHVSFNNFHKDLERLKVSKKNSSQKEKRLSKFKIVAGLILINSQEAEIAAAKAKDAAREVKKANTKAAAEAAEIKARCAALEAYSVARKIQMILLYFYKTTPARIFANFDDSIQQSYFN